MERPAPAALPSAAQLVGWPFAVLVATLLAASFADDAAGGGEDWMRVGGAAWYVGWAVWTLWLCRRHGIGVRRLLGRARKAADWRYVGMALPLLVLSVGLFVLQAVLASWVAPELVRSWMAEEPARALGPLAGALQVVVGVALAPVVEELVFRGVLLRVWTRRRGRAAAVVGTAALFAVLHPGDLLGSFVFGVVLAGIRLRTRTLLVPIACHALFNGLTEVLGAGAGAGALGGDDAPLTLAQLRGYWWVGAAAVAVSAPAIWIFLRRSLPPRRVPRPARTSLESEDLG